jgi:hypothetical protein
VIEAYGAKGGCVQEKEGRGWTDRREDKWSFRKRKLLMNNFVRGRGMEKIRKVLKHTVCKAITFDKIKPPLLPLFS